MTGPQPRSEILDIIPYKGGDPASDGWKLSSNENPLGCSEAAREAVIRATETLAIYPDGSAARLREAIGAKYSIDAGRIVCGTGSDEIFQLLGRAYLEPGDEVIQTEYAFLVYRLVAQQAGARLVSAPENDLCADVDAILAHVTPRTRIVFLANPNNPTGSYLPFDEIRRLHAGLREDILLVLDGAYAEYVRRDDYCAGMELAGEAPNVLMTRTFSKIYGLAALRLGWAYGPESVIDAIHRVRGPFNVNAPAIAAGVAALADDRFTQASADHNERELKRVSAGIAELGFRVWPSVGNFQLIGFEDAPGRTSRDADAFLRNRGIVVRGMAPYNLPDCLRLSLGSVQADDDVLAAFADFARTF